MLALPLHPSATSPRHGETGLSRQRGINGRGPAQAGREPVYAAKGLDGPVRRTFPFSFIDCSGGFFVQKRDSVFTFL